MTHDEIINMAREAGFCFITQRDGAVLLEHSDLIERFAALVAAEEREACAKICDNYAADRWNLYKGRPPYSGMEKDRANPETQGECSGAEYLADQIRARGEKGQS